MRDADTVAGALSRFRASGSPWLALPFFQDGSAERVAEAVDARRAQGAVILPPPDSVFAALTLTPLPEVRAVILGQDPYPTPGDAHGLAFSYRGARRLPASLRVILAEMAEDTGAPMPKTGDLSAWARQGVLLLNTALTVEAGQSGAHLALGWSDLTDQAVAAVSARQEAVAFLLWGAPARRRAALVDRDRHLVLEAGHPSPLNRRGDFRGARPFSRANAWLAEKGRPAIDWRLA
ncbi:uracil-DNA glycosylase [Methylobacterium sp. 4-46]|uniref:uracil-DNA glycosylase n=1 Tax=unclassified Methylobacterium TaxID=2615210 RepID=UPI000152C597|nr:MULTISPECIES: uracil-DNA glycosylase [Methylobacterium]ACA17022.1 uracil-DNA glycosylase [Methylobacterium sp. 4-46]WFT82711.1 uracil-DNA glycosylase [Methylobacterium nodulans]